MSVRIRWDSVVGVDDWCDLLFYFFVFVNLRHQFGDHQNGRFSNTCKILTQQCLHSRNHINKGWPTSFLKRRKFNHNQELERVIFSENQRVWERVDDFLKRTLCIEYSRQVDKVHSWFFVASWNLSLWVAGVSNGGHLCWIGMFEAVAEPIWLKFHLWVVYHVWEEGALSGPGGPEGAHIDFQC